MKSRTTKEKKKEGNARIKSNQIKYLLTRCTKSNSKDFVVVISGYTK